MIRSGLSIVFAVGVFFGATSCSRLESKRPRNGNAQADAGAALKKKDLPVPEGEVSETVIESTLSAGKKREAAALMTRMGELLLAPQTFGYALPQFEEALSLDPESARARFYVALLKPLSKYQGILSRSLDLGDAIHQKKSRERLKQISEGAHKNYIAYWRNRPTGTAPFKSFSEMQTFVEGDVIPSFKNSLKMMEGLKGDAIELKLPLAAWKNSASATPSCVSDGKQWKCSEIYPNVRIDLDSVDMTLVFSAMSTVLNAHRLSVAYSLEQVEKVLPALRAKSGVARAITQVEPLLKLRPHHELSLIQSELSSVLKQAYDTIALQDVICDQSDRKNSSVLVASLCLKDGGLSQALALVQSLEGPKEIQIALLEENEPLMIDVDFGRPFLKPLQDLKIFAIDKRADPSFGGIFPNEDATEKHRQIREANARVSLDLKWSILLHQGLGE
jgi:hypothetical protein